MFQSALTERSARAVTVLFACVPLALAAQAPGFDKVEFAGRRARLLEQIKDGIGVVFAAESHPYNVRYRESPDFYYLTGLEEPGAVLVLNGITGNAVVLAPKSVGGGGIRDEDKPQDRYGVTVLPLENAFTYFSFWTGNPAARRLYLQLTPPDDQLHARFEIRAFNGALEDQPVLGRQPPLTEAIRRLHDAAPQLELADISSLIDELRWVKTPYEISRLRQSGRIGAAAVAEAIRGTRPGMYEYELAAAAQYVNTRLGARGDGFLPIVPSGPNAPDVHYEKNTRQMQAGELVYLDYGSDWEYYVSDITRVWPVSGRFTAEQEKMYRCVLEARDAIIAAMKPGVTLRQLKEAAVPVYQKYGWLDAYEKMNRYIGHFIGISVHDVGAIGGPALERPLVTGVVFNVEPVLQFPERGIHLRLEDTVLITDSGAEVLTAGVPAGVDQIYALQREKGINDRPVTPPR